LFDELYKHMEWADATLWRAALSSPGAQSDETLRNYLHHMHLTQQLFLAFWTGTPAEPIARRQPSEFTLPELCAWAQPFYAQARAFLGTATPDVLARPLVMPWVAQYEKQLGRKFRRRDGGRNRVPSGEPLHAPPRPGQHPAACRRR
jgi:uncharacterized damage-inducible protein DinB